MRRRSVHLTTDSLRFRLLKIRLAHTNDLDRVERSRLTWGAHNDRFELTVLGVLNGLFGLVVVVPDEPFANPEEGNH